MSKTINFGVVGCGYWGPNLIRNLTSIKDASVNMVCDINKDRLDYIHNIYKVPCIEDYNVLVKSKNIDAIVIATPVSTHFKLAKQSLLAGKHTYVEKPMCSQSVECMELIDLAAKKNLALMVGHTFIYSNPVRKIKEIVDSGDIGKLLYVSSHRLNLGLFQKDINVVWDLAPHDISIILYIMGQSPVSINCQGKNHIGADVECVTNMSLHFADGSFAIVLSSWLDPNKVRKMTFVGSKKMILYDDTEPHEKIKIYDKRVEFPYYYDTFGEFHYSYHYGDMYSPYIQQTEPIKTECNHFIECIQQGKSPLTSGTEGLQVVQVLEAASKSLKNKGSQVNINQREQEKPFHLMKGEQRASKAVNSNGQYE